jgi:hypothetical protein
MTLAELRNDLRSFAVGDLPADAFANKLQALIVDTPLEMALPGGPLDGSVADQLVAQLAFHFEDVGDDPEARRWQARTLVAALDALAQPVVLDLLPLLFTKERFAGIIQKYLAGII